MMKKILIPLILMIFLFMTKKNYSQVLRKNIAYSEIKGFLTEWATNNFYDCFERKFNNIRVLYAEHINDQQLKVTGKVRYTKYRIPADREFSAIIYSNKVDFFKECKTCLKGNKSCRSAVQVNNKYWNDLFEY